MHSNDVNTKVAANVITNSIAIGTHSMVELACSVATSLCRQSIVVDAWIGPKGTVTRSGSAWSRAQQASPPLPLFHVIVLHYRAIARQILCFFT